MIERLKKILFSIRLFSSLVIQVPLRGYQIGPADAVIDSCVRGKGLEFLWVFPRQSGKDEAVAQLCAFLLSLFHRVEGGIVHIYPTSGQLATGVTRLEHRLDNAWFGGRWWSKSKPTRRGLGLAQVAFFSGHPMARAEGATANVLLIVNEAQDQVEAVVERRFTPMRASTNATALFVGTVRTTNDYLWRVKTRLEKLEADDGIRRVFLVSPYDVGAENPHYLEFVENQVKTKGRQHPAVRTEFFNEAVDVAAGLFPARRRALMLGTHCRQRTPQAGEVYVALIDVGGQDEGASELRIAAERSELQNAGRDYTVCTIARVLRKESVKIGPVFEVVDVFVDQGSRHFQETVGRTSLFHRLLAYLTHWNVAAAVCDATGVGQGLTDALTEAYKRQVFGFDFAKSYGKARLGNDFLAVVETGRFRYFRDDHDLEGSDAWWFFTQAEHCGYELAEGVPIERGLRWEVSPSARVVLGVAAGEDSTPSPALPLQGGGSRSVLVHDDRLLSAALIAEVDRLIREGDLFVATGESAVIRRDEGRGTKDGGWA
jgi:hypothetical protein